MPTADSPATTEPQPPFRHTLRVYWEDTDAGGVVYYANYLKYFERARTEWLRRGGLGQQALSEQTGALFIVTDAAVHYRAPARLDDMIDVTVSVRHRGGASLTLLQQAWRAGTLLAEAEIRVGCVDSGTFRPRPIPSHVARIIE
jgi:acyl-CoA thioester hydrolase